MSGRCAIPREAALLSRITDCKLPSQLHMSSVSAHLLSYGWAGVGGGFMIKSLKCNVIGLKYFSIIHNHFSVHLWTCVSHPNCYILSTLQVTCWVCLMTTPRPVRGCLEIWEDITWWLLCLSASTRVHLGLPAALSTSQSSLTMDTVGNISGCRPSVLTNYTLSESGTKQPCRDLLPTWTSAMTLWLCY